jgi:tetratricopeptide (TPR) repeat protein
LLKDAGSKAESLRAQALLLGKLGREAAAAELIEEGLQLSPEHPALLKASVEAARREKDDQLVAKLLVRSADAARDPVYKAELLRRAVLLLEELQAQAEPPAELEALHAEAVRKLFQADANDQVGFHAMLVQARSSNDWEAVLRLVRQRAERTGSAAERASVAAIASFRLGRVSEGLAEVAAALENNRRDPGLLALRSELAEQQKSADLPELLRQRAEGCIEPSERGHLKLRAALLLQDPLEREQLLSEALAENPGDAAAIALHARLVAQRDPAAAADRYAALGQALESHSGDEAAAHYLESGGWYERAGDREHAAEMGRRALKLVPRHTGALRLLMRTLPALGASTGLADILEEAAAQLPRGLGAEMLARAATLLGDSNAERAILLAQLAADMARGLSSPRWLELWAMLAFKAGDMPQLSQALEARADSTQGPDSAELLLEASELSRAAGDEARGFALLRKARGVDPSSAAARNALLALPVLPAADRVDLLTEEARTAAPERAAALHAERAAVLEIESRIDEAVQASAQALALGGVDLAVLRRLARLQLRRGDNAAALAVLVQIAEAVPEGQARAEAYGRAAELAEWRVGDPRRAVELYRAAAQAHPQAAFAWTQLARLLSWTGAAAEAADAYEHLAEAAQSMTERNEARRWAASLLANRAGSPAKAAPLLRALLSESPGDLEASAELLALIGQDQSDDARKERVELRGRLASRCQDPRVAALLRSESGEDRLAAGDRDQGIAEYRRALALNPQDRVALDLVEEALRGAGQRDLLAEHLAFRCAFADGETRAALSLQQAEIFTEQGRIEEAGHAYEQALASDPESLLAVKGARHIAELRGDKPEVMRLLAKEASLARDPGLAAGAMVEAALLAADMGDRDEAVQHLTTVLETNPSNSEVAVKLRGMIGDAAPRMLADIYERIGQNHQDPKLGAVAWTQAAAIKLHELRDAPGAFFASGRAVARDPESARALEARADAAEAAGRPQDAAEALQKRLMMDAPDDGRAAAWKLRLGRFYAELGDAASALPLLGNALDSLEGPVLLKLAPGARSLRQAEAVRLYRRLLDVFPVPQDPAPTRVQLAEWTDELARGYLALNQPAEALATFRRSVQLEPRNRSALRQVADLSEHVAPEESIAAHRTLLDMTPPAAESLHKLVGLFQSTGRPDAAYCAAAALVGVGAATAEERALHEAIGAKPPPVELLQLADSALVHAPGDEGTVRDLLSAAAVELARALPTDMSGGRGALVKGDNPVRRVVAAIARALGISEPQLYVARGEPAVVIPVAGDSPGLLVGGEVPKRYTPRQQRFLYTRALAHVRRGTHMLAPLPAARLATLVGELLRLSAPAGTDFARLPPGDGALAEALARQIGPEARARLAPLAQRAVAELPTNWDPLALGIRESAERAGLLACDDPGAAIALVAAEAQGGLDKPEVARLVRFAISESHLQARPK